MCGVEIKKRRYYCPRCRRKKLFIKPSLFRRYRCIRCNTIFNSSCYNILLNEQREKRERMLIKCPYCKKRGHSEMIDHLGFDKTNEVYFCKRCQRQFMGYQIYK